MGGCQNVDGIRQSRSQYVHHLFRRFHGQNRQLLDNYWVPYKNSSDLESGTVPRSIAVESFVWDPMVIEL